MSEEKDWVKRDWDLWIGGRDGGRTGTTSYVRKRIIDGRCSRPVKMVEMLWMEIGCLFCADRLHSHEDGGQGGMDEGCAGGRRSCECAGLEMKRSAKGVGRHQEGWMGVCCRQRRRP